ncbi:MFS transporter [Kocuria flava]|uniref:MFS transporter n=1 Tax=Kocuria flava TaxID=446860 RepID=UPI002151D72E|nr:MFS transporter [Kocuria flava]
MPTISPLRLRLTIASLLIVSCLGALDHTVVATSLATIAGELGALQQMSWVIVAYSLSTTVLLPVLGKLGDLLGPRRVYLASVAGFVLASLACGFATTLTGLVLARIAQGVGGAGIQLMSQTLVAELTTPRQRPRYLSIIGASFPIAVLIGPVLGGLITDAWGWRWVFWINIPLGVVALGVAAVTVPAVTPTARRRFDLPGALAFATSVVPLVLVLSWVTEGDPALRPAVVAAGAVAVTGFLALVTVETRTPEPLIPRTSSGTGPWSPASPCRP